MSLQFRDEEPRSVLYTWWTELEDNKGDRAALRRCREPREALFVPVYHQLYRRLHHNNGISLRRLSAIAALASHVKQVTTQDLATQMASPKAPGSTAPSVSELRFRRVLQCESVEELFPALRRIISLLEGKVNLYNLADSVYWWGDRVRRDWAYAYYGALKS